MLILFPTIYQQIQHLSDQMDEVQYIRKREFDHLGVDYLDNMKVFMESIFL